MDTQPQRRGIPVWIKILLPLSLAANLAIVGLIAGFVLRGGPAGGPGPSMGYAMPYVLALPRDMRRDVLDKVRRDDSLPNRRSRRAAYDDMIAALRATPFDAAAVEAVLARQSNDASRVQTAAQAAWLDAVSSFSDAERLAYTARMEEELQRKGQRKKNNDR